MLRSQKELGSTVNLSDEKEVTLMSIIVHVSHSSLRRREQQQREKEDALLKQQREAEVRTARMERNGRVVEMRRRRKSIRCLRKSFQAIG